MIKKISTQIYKSIGFYVESWLNSYSEIFFSKSKALSITLILVTFINPLATIGSMFCLLITIIVASLIKLNPISLKDGSLTFNSLLVGMVLGLYYEFSLASFILMVFASIFTLFVTIYLNSTFNKNGVPSMSLPFLITIWVVFLGATQFYSIKKNNTNVLTNNNFLSSFLNDLNDKINEIPMSDFIELYFRSIGNIFFQYSLLNGITISLILFFTSRIAFSLSILGFSSGYLFYLFMNGDMSQFITNRGFNFVLTAIALGGFFVIPSVWSYLLVIISTPFIALLISTFSALFATSNLPFYSLPFNITVILFLKILQQRYYIKNIYLVTYQQYSPEKNLYTFLNGNIKFKNLEFYDMILPVLGKWRVSQGYNGGITHIKDYQYALDFDQIGTDGKTFRNLGYNVEDYLCYNLPVIAPANGYIVDVQDGIEDNKIGGNNINNNWGNTVIIKHGENVFTKLSHLKMNSILVKIGDYVNQRDIIGYVGSSGRSPEPHLHFQVQNYPLIGSKPIPYQFSNFILNKDNNQILISNSIPNENDIICNLNENNLLKNAFNFLPGKTLIIKEVNEEKEIINKINLEIYTNQYNNPYFYNKENDIAIYFSKTNSNFNFTYFYGNKNSTEYQFYLALQKINLNYFPNIFLKEKLYIPEQIPYILRFIHDFTAPFFQYINQFFISEVIETNNINHPTYLKIKTKIINTFFKNKIKTIENIIKIENGKISEIKIVKNKKIKTLWLEYI